MSTYDLFEHSDSVPKYEIMSHVSTHSVLSSVGDSNCNQIRDLAMDFIFIFVLSLVKIVFFSPPKTEMAPSLVLSADHDPGTGWLTHVSTKCHKTSIPTKISQLAEKLAKLI